VSLHCKFRTGNKNKQNASTQLDHPRQGIALTRSLLPLRHLELFGLEKDTSHRRYSYLEHVMLRPLSSARIAYAAAAASLPPVATNDMTFYDKVGLYHTIEYINVRPEADG